MVRILNLTLKIGLYFNSMKIILLSSQFKFKAL